MSDISFGTIDSHIVQEIVSGVLIPMFDDEIEQILQDFDDSRIGPGSWLRPTEVLALRLKNVPYGLRPMRVEGYDPLDPNPNQGAMWWGAFEKELDKHYKKMAPILIQRIWNKLPEWKKDELRSPFDVELPKSAFDYLSWRAGYPSRPYVSRPSLDSESVALHTFQVSLPASLRPLTQMQRDEILPPAPEGVDPTYIGDVSIADLHDDTKGVVGIAAPLFGTAPPTNRYGKPKERPSNGYNTDPVWEPGKYPKVEVKPMSVEADLRIRRFLDVARHPMPEPEEPIKLPRPPAVRKAVAAAKNMSLLGSSHKAKRAASKTGFGGFGKKS